MSTKVGLELVKNLAIETPTKIIMVVSDGLGGFAHPDTGKTELETAKTPNLDSLANQGRVGRTVPVAHGITPGSGPGHLGLFGYDPLSYDIGRGILETLGIDMEVRAGDIAARGNFCTVDDNGIIVDRRAGRIPSSLCKELCEKLSQIKPHGFELMIQPGREHRFALILRGNGASDQITESDPQREGLKAKDITALTPDAERTAQAMQGFVSQARELLRESHPANMLLLRGFSKQPDIPLFPEIYKMRSAAIASYPMYRGLAKLIGMDVIPTGETIEDEINSVRTHWRDFDFFFVHYKATDSAGEDGDFDRKVQAIETLDKAIIKLLDLEPDVLVVAGDHSTPAILAAHSWHPVPLLIRSKWGGSGYTNEFSEQACAVGEIGTIPATSVMPLALANAFKLAKYGA